MIPGTNEPAIRDPYYIRATSLTANIPRLVLKKDEAFLVADRRGDCPDVPESEFGFYVAGTRFLCCLELLVYGEPPLVLNAAVSDTAHQIAVDLTNADLFHGDEIVLGGHTIRLARRLTLEADTLRQTLQIEAFTLAPHELLLAWRFAADFADVFEVRGIARAKRGEMLAPSVNGVTARLSYRGRDDVVRLTELSFDPPPEDLTASSARYRVSVSPGHPVELSVAVYALEEGRPRSTRRPSSDTHGREDGGEVRIQSSHEQFNAWLARARSDVSMLATDTPHGRIAYAGIPWYVAPFGRDSLITALQLLPFEPGLARGTLRFLARHQGLRDDAFTDQEPGKILHEYRQGEMAACREIAFIPYYGSVDATPLFVLLLAEYLRWTNDLDLARELWPSLERAVSWLVGRDGDRADQYLSYVCRSPCGLVNQGWKDSHDAIMHATGEAARAPIALAEVQGYKYAALRGSAVVAEAIGHADLATELPDAARRLQARFERDYWMDEQEFYALALDGDGAPCRVISSNPGHCLWTGIVAPTRAEAVARRLMGPQMFTGWGVRTLAIHERQYNPMSYHNGSVWPHDTAIGAAGLRRYGFRDAFLSLASGLFEAALHCEGLRLPELFCGFPRIDGYGPTPYPVACSPQAWAAGVVFQLLGDMLGLTPEAPQNRLTLVEPVLPSWLAWVEVRGLRLRDSSIDLLVTRGRRGAAVEILERRGDAEIVVRR